MATTRRKRTQRVLLLLLTVFVCIISPVCAQSLADVLSTFLDIDDIVNGTEQLMGLARRAFAEENAVSKDANETHTAVAVDDAYPLAPQEFELLLDLYSKCKTPESQALQTWCTGNITYLDEHTVLCPSRTRTHPCTGRVLKANRSDDEVVEFLWPWEGVKCDAYTDPTTITDIYLPDEHLRCRLDDIDLSPMVSLQQLDLSSNELHGPFPTWLGDLRALRILNLAGNQFSGELPSSFGDASALEVLDLSHNMLTGELPGDIASLGREDPRDPDEDSSLKVFDVSHNGFHGVVPNISTLTSLQTLIASKDPSAFSGNAFKCPLPEFLASTNLTCECGDAHSAAVSNSNTTSLAFRVDGIDGCKYCASGFYANASTGHQCSECPAGTFTVSLANITSHSNASNEYCTPCAPGTFATETRSEGCRPCPAGTFASEYGMTTCSPCFPGHFADGIASRKCSPCMPGTYAGTHGQNHCRPCPPGSYTQVQGEAECLPCPIGSYQSDEGSTDCKTCPKGYVAPFPGYPECIPCPPGSFFDVARSTCTRCPPHTFTNTSAQLLCQACPEEMAADGYGNAECMKKPEPGNGLILASDGNVTQVLCAPGSSNNAKRLTCEPCPPGTFAAASGSLQCTPCPVGNFAGQEGATSCDVAPIGTYVDREGAWNPIRCPPNHFADFPGSLSCEECPWPSFSLVGGSSNCSVAEPGEIYEAILWPTATMTIASISARDFRGAMHASGAEGAAPSGDDNLGNLRLAWTASLAAFGVTNMELHLIALDPQTPSDDLLVVDFAFETLSAPLPKRQKKNATMFQKLKTKTDEFHKFVDSTRASFENMVESIKANSSRSSKVAGSGSDSEDDEVDGNGNKLLVETISRPGFLDFLVRQLHHQHVIDISPSLVNITVLPSSSSLKSSRAVKCPKGTYYFSSDEESGSSSSECRLCPIGTYSDSLGMLTCSPCPQGTFGDEEGLETCWPCPSGGDAPPGSTECIECAFFTYACEGFWEDVAIATALAVGLGVKLRMRCKRLTCGDAFTQQQNDQAVLLAAVRAHGRTGTSVHYEPMVRAFKNYDCP
ncbi:Tyrosine-protein kinase ephrin type a/b receptor-like, partial [Globisporangium splendens]